MPGAPDTSRHAGLEAPMALGAAVLFGCTSQCIYFLLFANQEALSWIRR
jgi:hypothetical protein